VTTPSAQPGRVLLTDHPWQGVEVEAGICFDAGLELVEAPPGADLDHLIALGSDVVGILTCWSSVPGELIRASPRLKVVSRLGVGVDNIDVDAAAERGVTVTRVPDYCVEEVSDHVVALVFSWARGVTYFDRAVRGGRWEPGALPLRRVRDLVIGVWGSGLIGTRTAEKFSALGCVVLMDDRHPQRTGPYTVVSRDELLCGSDVLTLHLPMNEQNRGLVGSEVLSRMRVGSLLVNTSRGGLVDSDALAAALVTGRPSAAALDVLPEEPKVPASLANRENVVITPHVAFSSVQSVLELRARAAQDLVRVLRGEPAQHPYPTMLR